MELHGTACEHYRITAVFFRELRQFPVSSLISDRRATVSPPLIIHNTKDLEFAIWLTVFPEFDAVNGSDGATLSNHHACSPGFGKLNPVRRPLAA
jgi:hypothetical protein